MIVKLNGVINAVKTLRPLFVAGQVAYARTTFAVRHAVKRNHIDVDAESRQNFTIFQNVNSRVQRMIFPQGVDVSVGFESPAVHTRIMN